MSPGVALVSRVLHSCHQVLQGQRPTLLPWPQCKQCKRVSCVCQVTSTHAPQAYVRRASAQQSGLLMMPACMSGRLCWLAWGCASLSPAVDALFRTEVKVLGELGAGGSVCGVERMMSAGWDKVSPPLCMATPQPHPRHTSNTPAGATLHTDDACHDFSPHPRLQRLSRLLLACWDTGLRRECWACSLMRRAWRLRRYVPIIDKHAM